VLELLKTLKPPFSPALHKTQRMQVLRSIPMGRRRFSSKCQASTAQRAKRYALRYY